MRWMVILICILAISVPVWAKKVKNREVQNVDFEEALIDGQGKSPDGAYLYQKRSVDFVPLYQLKKQFQDNIIESIEYMK